MLILTRKLGESIKIGDGIEVKIVAIEGEQIKIGIDAPREIDIYRKEIFEAIQRENNQAAARALSPELLQSMQAVKKQPNGADVSEKNSHE